ncbi:MAG: hypothetical protein ABSG79_09670 [Bryobacteraceae bacterium]
MGREARLAPRLENGKQSMTLRTLKIIADTLGVRVRDLIGNL